MKNFFDVPMVNTEYSRAVRMQKHTLWDVCLLALLSLFLCPAFSYAENPQLINLSAISIVESNNKAVIGDKHLKNHAYGIYQIRLPLLTDYNRATKSNLTIDQMMIKEQANKVASWAFNSYYPRILKAKGHKPSRIALLTCWNMGQGSFFMGKRASSYESKYLKALQRTNNNKARVKHGG